MYQLLRYAPAAGAAPTGGRVHVREAYCAIEIHAKFTSATLFIFSAQILRRYLPGALFNHDREGRPLWLMPLGDGDYRGVDLLPYYPVLLRNHFLPPLCTLFYLPSTKLRATFSNMKSKTKFRFKDIKWSIN